jgi:hypothetical protein
MHNKAGLLKEDFHELADENSILDVERSDCGGQGLSRLSF